MVPRSSFQRFLCGVSLFHGWQVFPVTVLLMEDPLNSMPNTVVLHSEMNKPVFCKKQTGLAALSFLWWDAWSLRSPNYLTTCVCAETKCCSNQPIKLTICQRPPMWKCVFTHAFWHSTILPSGVGIHGVAPGSFKLIIRVPAVVLWNRRDIIHCKLKLICFVSSFLPQPVSHNRQPYYCLFLLTAIILSAYCFLAELNGLLPWSPSPNIFEGSSFNVVLCGVSWSHLWQVLPDTVLVKDVPQNSVPWVVVLHSASNKYIEMCITSCHNTFCCDWEEVVSSSAASSFGSCCPYESSPVQVIRSKVSYLRSLVPAEGWPRTKEELLLLDAFVDSCERDNFASCPQKELTHIRGSHPNPKTTSNVSNQCKVMFVVLCVDHCSPVNSITEVIKLFRCPLKHDRDVKFQRSRCNVRHVICGLSWWHQSFKNTLFGCWLDCKMETGNSLPHTGKPHYARLRLVILSFVDDWVAAEMFASVVNAFMCLIIDFSPQNYTHLFTQSTLGYHLILLKHRELYTWCLLWYASHWKFLLKANCAHVAHRTELNVMIRRQIRAISASSCTHNVLWSGKSHE